MSAKKLVLEFYKSDALINGAVMENFLHEDFKLEWHSSRGFLQMDRKALLALANELQVAYVRSKCKISNIIAEKDIVSVSYSHYIKTMENPREEMLLAHFMVNWEIRDEKLYRGYQMSQIE